MKTLFIDCGMGAAGDMLTAALLELLPDGDAFLEELNALGIPEVRFEREKSVKCGILGTHMKVTVHGEEEGSHDHDHHHDHDHDHHHDHDHDHDHHDHDHTHSHHHATLHDIEHIVRGHLSLPQKVQDDIMAVYTLIAEAESHAHGRPVSEIHFHEVGTMDAIADITAVCMLMNRLAPDRVVVSPIHVGSGQVKCAHGILPVPAPATAFILREVPVYSGEIRGELCTPTGAALLRHFATQFGEMPMMRVKGIGYGMGKKEFPVANCVRVMFGESEVPGSAEAKRHADVAGCEEAGRDSLDDIFELSCNMDDMTGEAVGFAMERLFEAGARDVYTVPIGMKKSRPGILLRVLCTGAKKEEMIRAIFRYTTTIGIRETKMNRYILDREIQTVQTPYGEVRCKVSTGYGVARSKYEYEDLARIAREQGETLDWIRKEEQNR